MGSTTVSAPKMPAGGSGQVQPWSCLRCAGYRQRRCWLCYIEGTEPWGVAGCHGFVGALLRRRGNIDGKPLLDAPLFTGHSFDLEDRELHIIKAVLMAKDGRWQRILELDGHSDRYADDWPDGPPCPDGGHLMVRFAIVWGRASLAGGTPSLPRDGDQLVFAVRRALTRRLRCAWSDKVSAARTRSE